MQNKNIIGALVALVFTLIITVTVVYTRAADPQDATTTATITNTAPVVDEVRISTTAYGTDSFAAGIPLNVGANKTIHVTGIVSDANGEDDIASTSVTLYRTSVGSSCTPDQNDCYTLSACTLDLATAGDTEVLFDCELSLAYWTDATADAGRFASDDWTALVTVTDQTPSAASLAKVVEVNSLLALNIPEAINYGNRVLGEQTTAATNQETILTQRGNTKADVELQGTAMTCDGVGTIPVANQRWSLTDVAYASSTNNLSTTATAASRNVDYRESESTELAASLFWNIGIPATGVQGSCTGNNTISILAVPVITTPIDADGNTYNTVTIGTQTWLATNMNVGTMLASAATNPSNSGVIEKWCYNNSATNCTNQGGLYSWTEAMQGSTTEGAQGICPSGYHIPTDNEYKTLEIFLGMTQVQADATGFRGTDQGTKLKAGGSSGFNALLPGYRHDSGSFTNFGTDTYFWTSSESSTFAWRRGLTSSNTTVYRSVEAKAAGHSIRCLMN